MDDYGGMVTADPNARFKITDVPALPPGADFITRSINGPFIDTGFDVAWGSKGRMYLTVDTIREMADIAGLLSTDESEKVRYDAAYKEGYADALREKLDDNLRSTLAELIDVLTPVERDPVLSVVEDREEVAVVVEAGDAPEPPDDEQASGGDAAPNSDTLDDSGGGVEGGDEAPEPDPAPSRKRDGTSVKRRRADIPSDTSDGTNPFRL